MMRKAFFLLLAVSLLLVSCRAGVEPVFSDVTLEIDTQKNLTATQMDVVAYYRYDAELLGDAVSDEGTAEDEILLVNGGTASLGRLAQGRWRFTVRAYNPRDAVLYEGSVEMYVGSSAFTARVVLGPHTGSDGKLSVDITTLKARTAPPSLIASWKSLDGTEEGSASTWTVADGHPDSEHVRYTGEITVPEGRYSLTLSLFNDAPVAFSVVDMMIVGGDTTTVTGFLNPMEDQDISIKVEGPADIRGHIEATASAALGSPLTLRWINDGDQVSAYRWSVNGTVQSSTSYTMSFTPQTEGMYSVSCVAMNGYGESGDALLEIDLSGFGWQSLGLALLNDYGSSKGTYSVSYDGTMVEKISGTGGRYLGFAGYYKGNGSASTPHVIWAPYVGGSNSTSAIGATSESGRSNTALICAQDTVQAPHALSGNQVISAGGAYAAFGDDGCHIPSKAEMEYVKSALAAGKITLPDGLYWTSTEQGTQAWALSVSSNTGTWTLVSKTATGGMVYVRLV